MSEPNDPADAPKPQNPTPDPKPAPKPPPVDISDEEWIAASQSCCGRGE
jgi:hypothetical protein